MSSWLAKIIAKERNYAEGYRAGKTETLEAI